MFVHRRMPMLLPPRFLDDWRELLCRHLNRLGFTDADTVETTGSRPLELAYFLATERLIERRPRRVHEARSFRVSGSLGKRYYSLRHKVSSGADLRPHQSSRILSVEARDHFLEDWGIQHLHLGRWFQENGLVERTGPVLLCLFRPNDAYVIAIESHDWNSPPLWGDQRYAGILVENWPHLFREFEVAYSPGIAETTAGDRKLVTLSNGRQYVPFGKGVQLDDSVSDSLQNAESWLARIAAAEAATKLHFGAFVRAATLAGSALPEALMLRLIVDTRLWASLEGSRLYWCLEPALPPLLADSRKRFG